MDHRSRHPRRSVTRFVVAAIVIAAVSATVPVDATTAASKSSRTAKGKAKPTAAKPKTTAATAPSTSSTIAPTTTAPGVPAAKIIAFEPKTGSVSLRLEPPSRTDLTAEITIEAIGFEESTRVATLTPGATDYTDTVAFNADTQYTYRVRWRSTDGQVGPTDEKVIAPFFPQPKYRGPVIPGGPGWSVIYTSDFKPTRRNPCAPIEVFYDRRNEQVDLTEAIKADVAQAAEASGVPMTFIGAGTVRPTKPRVLIIDWVVGAVDYLGVTRQGQQKDARGVVWRTTQSISLAASRRVVNGRWDTVVLHELGHVLGLQHSHDPSSLMFSPGESNEAWPWVTTVYTAADREGLRKVNAGSSGGCSPTISKDDLWNGIQGP